MERPKIITLSTGKPVKYLEPLVSTRADQGQVATLPCGAGIQAGCGVMFNSSPRNIPRSPLDFALSGSEGA